MNTILLKKAYGLLILGILSFFFACDDEWKQPTDVGFIVDMNYASSLSGKLSFSSGEITLADFSFDGDRVEGDDVYFKNTFPSGLKIIFNPNTTVESLNFDIPQGDYTKMVITLDTYGAENGIHIKTSGAYINANNDSTYVICFEYKAAISYSIFAQNTSGLSEIVLNKDIPVNAKIIFDPIYWFQPLSANQINNAEVFDVNGIPTILINDTCNEIIYGIVSDRIDNGTKIIF